MYPAKDIFELFLNPLATLMGSSSIPTRKRYNMSPKSATSLRRGSDAGGKSVALKPGIRDRTFVGI